MLTVGRLPLEAQTAYAELVRALLATRTHADPSDGPDVDGTVVEKVIGGRTYLYLQERAMGSMRQTYLGSDTPAVRAHAEEITRRARARRTDDDVRAVLVRVARAGGCASPTAAEQKVLETLARHRVFSVGGILVGTHAFTVLSNALGMSASLATLRTADIDLVHDPRIMVALDDAEARPIARMEKETVGGVRLWAVPGFDRRQPSTSFKVHGTQLQLDFLTPQRTRSDAPVELPTLGTAALPLKYLDYLVEETAPGAVVGGAGVLVNVPDPSRFALHKLIVAELRPAVFATQTRKDLLQSEALLRLLLTDRPRDVRDAWRALDRRGRGWSSRARRSITKLDPLVRARLADAIA